MRAILILLLCSFVFAGCRHPKGSEKADSGRQAKPEATSDRKGANRRDAGAQGQQATPVTEPAGKVASVNPGLRFVVIDFAFNPMPQVDQTLGVYRQGQKVGEVKISNQTRNSIVAADIIAGEAKVGDEVRPQ